MTQLTIPWASSTLQQGLRRASLILACTLFLISSAQNLQSPLPRQFGTDRGKQVSNSFLAERQGRRDMQVRPKSGKIHPAANVQPAAEAAKIPLFFEEPRYPTGNGPDSVTVGDFNGDGKLDLAIANGTDNTVSVLLGNGDGAFQQHVDYATGSSPSSVAVGDFNGDGKPDLAVANGYYIGSVSILLGNGDGTFQLRVDYATGSGPSSVALGDFNGDGKLDLVVANSKNGSVSVLLGGGDGTFQARRDYDLTSDMPASVAVGDFNGDGRLDLAVANDGGGFYFGYVSVLLGNGDGTFQTHVDYAAGIYPTSVAVGDLNGDGKPDLVVKNYSYMWPRDSSNTVSVLLGNGDGTFQQHVDYATGSCPSSVAIGDFNGDGKPDLAVANACNGTVSLRLGNGDGTFQARKDYVTGWSPASVVVADFNGDGRPDLAVANAGDSSVSVLLGTGDGTLQMRLPYYSTGSGPVWIAAGDLNGDGWPDLAVANWNDNTVTVLLSNGDGTFQAHADYPTGGNPTWVTMGDFNRDGKQDVVVTNDLDNMVSILLGNGDGTFQTHVDYAAGDAPSSVSVADFNGDGKPDLVVVNHWDSTVSVLLGNGNGSFQAYMDYATGDGPLSVAVGDFNSDGKPDLAVANNWAFTASVLLGNGDGTFQPHMDYASGGYPVSVAAGDFNGDGKLDLAVANDYDAGVVSVLLGGGDGSFQARRSYATARYQSFPSSVAVGDFNGDGNPDLVLTTSSNSVNVLLGNGDGTFQTSMEYAGAQSVPTVADFNLDGAPDLAVVSAGRLAILLNIRGTTATLLSSTNPSLLGQSVTLTGTVRASLTDAGLSVPTGTITFLDGTSELGTQALGADGVATLAIATLTPGTHSISAVYSGDVNFNPHTALVSQIVNAPDFGMSAAPGSATVQSGSSAVFAVAVTPIYGFGEAVSLTCSVSPTPALAPTCALSPTSTPTASGSVISELTVMTSGPMAARTGVQLRPDWRPFYSLSLPVFGLAVLGAGLAARRAEMSKRIMLGILLMNLLVIGLGSQIACGGGGSSSHVSSFGTPPGQYTVTVNAVSGSITHSAKVTLTVQ